jgi:hypothetical protein
VTLCKAGVPETPLGRKDSFGEDLQQDGSECLPTQVRSTLEPAKALITNDPFIHYSDFALAQLLLYKLLQSDSLVVRFVGGRKYQGDRFMFFH